MMSRWSIPCLLLALNVACVTARPPRAPRESGLPSWSEQLDVREGWLARKHALLLPMMRQHGVGMWIIVNEEFHDDPLTPFVAPPRPYAGLRDVFVFIDAGEQGLRKVALPSYAEEHVARFFEVPDASRAYKEVLGELYRQHQPSTIALGIGGRRGVTHSLTRDAYAYLVEALGSEAEARFISAAPLIEEYLDTRLPEEREHYRSMVVLTERMVRRAFSAEVVRPGVTRVGDVRRWLYDELGRWGVGTWFQPDLRVQRQGLKGGTSRGFLAVAPEDVVIQRGDLLHVDFGLSFMGLHTDWQKMAYVLREGERAVPEGLKRALANTNALQDALVKESRPGRPAAEVYEAVMAEMKAQGIEAQVYSHPLGNQGHALGASIDFRAARRQEEPKRLREGSYIAIELSTRTPVPEWDGQEVFAMAEDPAWLSGEGWRFFVPRQDSYYLIP